MSRISYKIKYFFYVIPPYMKFQSLMKIMKDCLKCLLCGKMWENYYGKIVKLSKGLEDVGYH